MEMHALVWSTLVCTTLGLQARAASIKAESSGNDKQEYLNALRFEKEIEDFSTGLYVYNDDGEPVEVTPGPPTLSLAVSNTNLKDSVKFWLYTRHNPLKYEELFINDTEALASSHFNTKIPTRFITHGWISQGYGRMCTHVRDAYLENGDVNVIVVDWSSISTKFYIRASREVLKVGQRVAKMIDFLEEHANLDTHSTILVGHSLGAHVVGLAGYYAKGTINSIVGLDPVLPGFSHAGPGFRISTEDANVVQIIHTNARLIGFRDPIGHSDFYPNGGEIQPGCGWDFLGTCSHARAYFLFAESINSNVGFYGKPCDTYEHFMAGICNTNSSAIMGGPMIGREDYGKYFLNTASESSYARGI